MLGIDVCIIILLFQFPTVCDYHDAHYAVHILDNSRKRIQQIVDEVYDEDGSQNVEIIVRAGMERNERYIAVIIITTAVKSTTTEFAFRKYEH